MRKKIKFLLFAILLICVFFFVYGKSVYVSLKTQMKYADENEISFYEEAGIKIFIKYETPVMSFGSGHKTVYVFSKYNFLIGKAVFGEFPMEILSINSEDKIILIAIKERAYDDYVKSWIEKNKKIGRFSIHYEFS